MSSQLRDINVGYYVTQILDAICHVYGEEDCILLQTFSDFLSYLGNEPRYREDLERSISLQFIQQIFLVLDYTQGCNRANEMIFRLAREAIPLYSGDIHSLLELIMRTVSGRLEINTGNTKPCGFIDCSEAIMLLDAVLRALKRKTEIEEMSLSQIQNVKLQLEQIIPNLCSLFEFKHSLDQKISTDIDFIEKLDQTANTYCAVLTTMTTIAGREDWIELVCKQLKNPSDVITQIRSVIDHGNLSKFKQNHGLDPRYTINTKCFTPVIAELIELCVTLGTAQEQYWSTACQNLVSDEALIGDIAVCMQKGCHTEEIGKLLVSLSEGKLTKEFTNSLNLRNMRMANSCGDNTLGNSNPDVQVFNMTTQLMTNYSSQVTNYSLQDLSQKDNDVQIGEIMDTVTKAVANSQVDESLSDIFDLNEYRLMTHKRQIDSLKTSLKAADQRISEAGIININLESEITKLNSIMKNLLRKLELSEKELSAIKSQYSESQDDNTKFRQNLLKEIDEKTKNIERLEDEKIKVVEKGLKYKERLIEAKKTIDENQQVLQDLQEKLKEESKQKNGMYGTVL